MEQVAADEVVSEEQLQEDRYVDQLGLHLRRVAGLYWPNLITLHVCQVGLGLVLLATLLTFLTAKFVSPAILGGSGTTLSPVLTILAQAPITLVLSLGLSGFMFFLVLGNMKRYGIAAIVFLGHIEALYETMASEGEDRFMDRVKRIFRKVEQNGSSFTHALLEEPLVVQPGSEKERYGLASDVSSRFIQFCSWGLLAASSLLLRDALDISTEILAFLWVWVL